MDERSSLINLNLRPGARALPDLPWHVPLNQWQDCCLLLEDVPRGLSRHTIVFINIDGVVYALKEMPVGFAEREYQLLMRFEEMRLPAVIPAGHVLVETPSGPTSILITRYLERSLPYRSLFMSSDLERYQNHILDAMAGLLVQLHLSGVFWGDCSLSNTLFRRDAGMLQAYMVDAETAEIHPEPLEPPLRHDDLQIMEENVDGDLVDLLVTGRSLLGIPLSDISGYIRLRYQALWEEITRELVLAPGERYLIQEHIRALNELGFSVGEVEINDTDGGDQVRLQAIVTDRNFHRDQLQGLTGLDTEEMQARQMMNEIHEVKAGLSRAHNRSTPLSVAAYHWMENIYRPVMEKLMPLVDVHVPAAELYCQVLEHKWYLSEKAHHDVGHQVAVDDYLQSFGAGKKIPGKE